jgi:hypothetical protein
MVGCGTKPGLLELAAIKSVCSSLGGPAVIPVSGTVCSPAPIPERFPIGSRVGASFTGITVTLKDELAWAELASLTVSVTVATPNCSGFGTRVIVLLVPEPPIWMLWNKDGFDESAKTLRLPAGVSTSETVNGIAALGVSSLIAISAILEITGESLKGSAVTLNVVVAVPPLASVTTMLIVAVPVLLVAGVTVTNRFVPLPPSTTFAFGIRVTSDEVADRVRLAAEVSTSVIVKASGPVDVSSLIV